MDDMAAKIVEDEQTAKKVVVVGGGLVRFSVNVLWSSFTFDSAVVPAWKILVKILQAVINLHWYLQLIARVHCTVRKLTQTYYYCKKVFQTDAFVF